MPVPIGSLSRLKVMATTTTGAPTTRTQGERSEATSGALLDAARRLFARDGFVATSLDAVVAEAGVTKGALYHHFDSKQDLFRAVFDREQARLAQALAEAFLAHEDPWEGLQSACRAFLDTALDHDVQRIVLVDSFSALGFATVREAEAGLLEGLREALRLSMTAGRLDKRPAEPLAALLFGALCEAALTTARAQDERTAHADVTAELDRVFAALSAS
jgi:AcrR family transcriptional regulator